MSGPFYSRDATAKSGVRLTQMTTLEVRTEKDKALLAFEEHWLVTHTDHRKTQVFCHQTADPDAGFSVQCASTTRAFVTLETATEHWMNHKDHVAAYKVPKTEDRVADRAMRSQMEEKQAVEIRCRQRRFREVQAAQWGTTLPVSAEQYPQGYGPKARLEVLLECTPVEDRHSMLFLDDCQLSSPAELRRAARGTPALEMVFRGTWMDGLQKLTPFGLPGPLVIDWDRDMSPQDVRKGIDTYQHRVKTSTMDTAELTTFPPVEKRKRKTEAPPTPGLEPEIVVQKKPKVSEVPRGGAKPKASTKKKENEVMVMRKLPEDFLPHPVNGRERSGNYIYGERFKTYYRLEGELIGMKKRSELIAIRGRILEGGSKVQLSEKELRILNRFHTKRCERSVAFVQLLHAAKCMRKREPTIDEAQRIQEAGYYLAAVNRRLEVEYTTSVRDETGQIRGSMERHLPAQYHGSAVPTQCRFKDVAEAGVDDSSPGVPYINERNLRKEAMDVYEEARKTSMAYHPDPMEGQDEGSADQQKGGVFNTPSWLDSSPHDSGRPVRSERGGKDLPKGASSSSKGPKASEPSSGGSKANKKRGQASATSTVTSGSVYPHSTPPDTAPIFQKPNGVQIKRAPNPVAVPKWTGPAQPKQELPANGILGADLTEPARIQKAIFMFKGHVASGPPTIPSGNVGLVKLRACVNVELEREQGMRKKMKIPTSAEAAASKKPDMGLARQEYATFEADFSRVSQTMKDAREGRKAVASYTAGLWWDAEVTSATLHQEAVPQSVTLPRIHPDLPDLVVTTKEVADARETLLANQVQYGADLRRHLDKLAMENSRLKDENSNLQVELETLRKEAKVHQLVHENLQRVQREKEELTARMRVQATETCQQVKAATDRTNQVLQTFDDRVEVRALHRISELELQLNVHYQCMPQEEPYVPSIAHGVQHPPNTVVMHTRNHRDALRHIELGQLMLTHPNLVRGRDALGNAVDFTNRMAVARVPPEEVGEQYIEGGLEAAVTFKTTTLDGGRACPSYEDAQWVKQEVEVSNQVEKITTAELADALMHLKTEEPGDEDVNAAVVVMQDSGAGLLTGSSEVASVLLGPLGGPSQVKQELKEDPDEMETQDDDDDGLLESDDDEKPFDPSDSEEEGLLGGDGVFEA